MAEQTTPERADHPRAVGVLFKMSHADRQALKKRAAEAGCETVQQYLELVALGRHAPVRSAGRPITKRNQEQLPMTA